MKKLKPESRKLERQVLKWHNENFDKLTGLKIVNGKLRMFTPEAKETIKLKPEITYKMKKVLNSIKKAILHLNILSLLFLFACGSEDNPITGNPPTQNNDSLVLTVDSLSIWGIGTNTNDTTLFNVFNTGDSVKVTLSTETNCTSQDTALVSGNCGNISFSLNNSNFPASLTYYGRYETFGTAFLVYLKSTSLRYAKLKNIKLYKI